MTVKELIQELKSRPQESEIVLALDEGGDSTRLLDYLTEARYLPDGPRRGSVSEERRDGDRAAVVLWFNE
jgi:hypothetical protein